MLTYFRARTKDFCSAFLCFNSPIIVTANTTVTTGLGGISDKDTAAPNSAHTAYIDEVHFGAVTAPADADGATTLNLFKYDSSAASAVQLITSFDLESLTSGKTDSISLDAGVTDQQRMLDYGDFLYVTTVNDSAALDTAMAGGAITVLIKLIT
jgi:hypothetical protein